MSYIQMNGPNFVNKLLGGERDFSKIQLPKGYDLAGYEGFSDLQRYLKEQDLRRNPVIIGDSSLVRLQAPGLYLPYVQGRGADLGGADLRRADLRGADLWGADLRGADLWGADLRRAGLRGADLGGADLGGAGLGGADLWGADLWGADLRGVGDLKTTLNLCDAIFRNTIVTEAEKQKIEAILKERKLFDVRN